MIVKRNTLSETKCIHIVARLQRIILPVRGWKVSAAARWEQRPVSVGRVSPVRAAYRSVPGARAHLSMLRSRGVSASEFLSRSIALRSSSPAALHSGPRSVLAPVLKRFVEGRRLGRGRVVQARLVRIEARVARHGRFPWHAALGRQVAFRSRRLQ